MDDYEADRDSLTRSERDEACSAARCWAFGVCGSTGSNCGCRAGCHAGCLHSGVCPLAVCTLAGSGVAPLLHILAASLHAGPLPLLLPCSAGRFPGERRAGPQGLARIQHCRRRCGGVALAVWCTPGLLAVLLASGGPNVISIPPIAARLCAEARRSGRLRPAPPSRRRRLLCAFSRQPQQLCNRQRQQRLSAGCSWRCSSRDGAGGAGRGGSGGGGRGRAAPVGGNGTSHAHGEA